jgi:3-deoxy-7-phosphoheptulonate synthase
MAESWSPSSWQDKPVTQIPAYPDRAALDGALDRLHRLPPLVTSWEIENLKAQLAEVAKGQRFLLQGGDCAERLDECDPNIITGKLKILLQMSLILAHGSRRRVTRVGRFAGQYAKPRSSDIETRDNVSLPSYRGDIVNRPAFKEHDRTPDPELLIQGYKNAALTLNFIRSLIDGGFADLHHPEYWHLDFVQHSDKAASYEKIVADIAESIRFLEVVSGQHMGELGRVEFYTSHEGLHLYYEQAQTRQVPRRTGWYNLSTHFPWIGNRTRQLGGAHIEYFRGIENPLGVKVGPDMTADELLGLMDILDPNNEPGRLTLIHRFGSEKIGSALPALVRAVHGAGRNVVWCCDPMHGNTVSVDNGVKTRDFLRILSELESAFDIHQAEGSYLGGVHFELTGENVTECTGGARGLTAADLGKDYRSHVDPRLNYEQALEMAILMAQKMRNGSDSR